MDKYHGEHTRYVAGEMLRDVRETTHSWLAERSTYEKVDTAGWRLEYKEPSIRIYQSESEPSKFMIVVTSRKRNYIRVEDYARRGR